MTLNENQWYIQVPWGRIAVVAWGDCYGPPVLLCHGNMDSAVSFRSLVKQLPQNYYYIGVELPGNGISDRYPPGLMITIFDLAYALKAVVRHFRWKTFTFLGHSMGAVLGQIYNVCYPGDIEKLIQLDPINFLGIPSDAFPAWYKTFFTNYFKNYDKYNASKEEAKKVPWKEALDGVMKKRPLLNEEQAAAVLERLSEPAGNGYVRYAFDRRNELIHLPPYSPEHIRTVFTAVTTPILMIICKNSLKKSLFRNTDFLQDEKSYPAGNTRVRIVEGGHDVHISNPDRVSPYLAQFIVNGLDGIDNKSKL